MSGYELGSLICRTKSTLYFGYTEFYVCCMVYLLVFAIFIVACCEALSSPNENENRFEGNIYMCHKRHDGKDTPLSMSTFAIHNKLISRYCGTSILVYQCPILVPLFTFSFLSFSRHFFVLLYFCNRRNRINLTLPTRKNYTKRKHVGANTIAMKNRQRKRKYCINAHQFDRYVSIYVI